MVAGLTPEEYEEVGRESECMASKSWHAAISKFAYTVDCRMRITSAQCSAKQAQTTAPSR